MLMYPTGKAAHIEATTVATKRNRPSVQFRVAGEALIGENLPGQIAEQHGIQ
jgi:hypothetical protein